MYFPDTWKGIIDRVVTRGDHIVAVHAVSGNPWRSDGARLPDIKDAPELLEGNRRTFLCPCDLVTGTVLTHLIPRGHASSPQVSIPGTWHRAFGEWSNDGWFRMWYGYYVPEPYRTLALMRPEWKANFWHDEIPDAEWVAKINEFRGSVGDVPECEECAYAGRLQPIGEYHIGYDPSDGGLYIACPTCRDVLRSR